MSARDEIPADVKAMKTSDIVRLLAIHEALFVMETVFRVGLSPGRAKSDSHVDHLAAKLDARIPPRVT